MKKIGIIFGNGSSIDELPSRFFSLAKRLVTLGVNAAPLCVKFKENDFEPDIYAMLDNMEREPVIAEHAVAHNGVFYIDTPQHHNKIDVPDEKRKICELRQMKFVVEYGMLILAHDYKCDEIICVGCESYGTYHRCKPLQPFDCPWEPGHHTQKSFDEAVKLFMSRFPNVPVFAWPFDSMWKSTAPLTTEVMLTGLTKHVAALREKEKKAYDLRTD